MRERLDAFMARANAAYYASHDPFADFTTAPEISQVFGEILGLWAAVAWQAMGSPDEVILAEAGPGRGTLMADALRAAALVPPFRAALRLHLVETSPRLRAVQAGRLPQPVFHDRVEALPDGPLLLLANEFLDALPIRQLLRHAGGASEHFVDNGALVAVPPVAGDSVVEEICEPARALAAHLGARLAAHGGAALFVDYGPEHSAPGDSLQALRGGRAADPLAEPGTADLTAHVDFQAFGAAARAAGGAVQGPAPQGVFLTRLGLFQRTGMLARGLPPAKGQAMIAAAKRLAEPDRMGRLFKAICVCDPALPPLPGFARMTETPFIAAGLGVPHGFFTRIGGVSEGPFASLNCSLSGQDARERVLENRGRAARALGAAPESLVGLTQVHGPDVAVVEAAWAPGAGPRADAMVTARPGLALGIVTADCAPVLFADAEAGVVGAAHAGWRGALGGVLEATLAAMLRLGAQPARVAAAVGPCIGQASYEVAADLRDAVLARDAAAARFFADGVRQAHWQFDLAGYCVARLRAAGIGQVAATGQDTLAEQARFFSHRRRTLAGGGPIGHQIAVIAR